jgi:hypothetical protein
MIRRRNKADPAQVVHHGFLLEVDGSYGLQAMDERPEENMSQECPECGKKLKSGGDKCDACGYSPKKLHDDDDDDDLIDVEADPRQEMLKYLREIRPEVEAKGSDGMKRRWNDAWRSVKTGRHPRESLDRLRRQYDNLRTADTSDRMHRRQGADANDGTCGRDLASLADDFLGRDVGEVAVEREQRALRQKAERQRTCRSFDSRVDQQQWQAEDLALKAEQMGAELRSRKY